METFRGRNEARKRRALKKQASKKQRRDETVEGRLVLYFQHVRKVTATTDKSTESIFTLGLSGNP